MLNNELNLKNFAFDGNESKRVRYTTKFANEKLSGALIVAEVGVQAGINAKSILLHSEIKRLYLIDPYGATNSPYENHEEYFIRMFNNIEEFADKVMLIRQPSLFAAFLFNDEYFDWVYIDAMHDTINAGNDIKAWFHKVRFGGVVSGHDIGDPRVRKAVDEFVVEYNKEKSDAQKLELIIKIDSDSDDWMFIKK